MDVKPFLGVGKVRFGETRQETRQTLGSQFSSFRKSPGANETDAFDELGLHVYYDSEDRVNFVEAFEPAPIRYEGILLLGRSLQSVDEDMRTLGCCPRPFDLGLDYETAGLSLFAPNDTIEGVGVFSRDYFPKE